METKWKTRSWHILNIESITYSFRDPAKRKLNIKQTNKKQTTISSPPKKNQTKPKKCIYCYGNQFWTERHMYLNTGLLCVVKISK